MSKKGIIIGVGIASIAAYNRLSENGFDVIILEARDRIGGRIVTDNTMGIPFGLGAGWIHGAESNPITTISREYRRKDGCR